MWPHLGTTLKHSSISVQFGKLLYNCDQCCHWQYVAKLRWDVKTQPPVSMCFYKLSNVLQFWTQLVCNKSAKFLFQMWTWWPLIPHVSYIYIKWLWNAYFWITRPKTGAKLYLSLLYTTSTIQYWVVLSNMEESEWSMTLVLWCETCCNNFVQVCSKQRPVLAVFNCRLPVYFLMYMPSIDIFPSLLFLFLCIETLDFHYFTCVFKSLQQFLTQKYFQDTATGNLFVVQGFLKPQCNFTIH